MKRWKFTVKNNSQEMSNQLESSLGTLGGFVLDIHQDEKKYIVFKMRKTNLIRMVFDIR